MMYPVDMIDIGSVSSLIMYVPVDMDDIDRTPSEVFCRLLLKKIVLTAVPGVG